VGIVAILIALFSAWTASAKIKTNETHAPAGSTAIGLPSPRIGYLETTPMHIDKIYPSMEGPHERIGVNTTEIDWITAFKTEVIDSATDEPMGEEFLCHSQLQLNDSTRLMVAATGSSEIRFPAGFGMPVAKIISGLPEDQRMLSFLGMVLNNHEPDIDRTARVRATVEFYRDEDLGPNPPLRKIYKVGLPMTVEELEAFDPPSHSVSADDVATHCVLVDGLKSHWVVPPGQQVTRRQHDFIVPVESTVHLIITHLHNGGDYLRLTDLTTGEILFQTDVIYEEDRQQIATIPVYSSAEGFTIYPDHTYQIEASYRNDTGHDIDAMAVMDLYYHPKGNIDITYER
jgi:hypothetical protein